MTKFRSLLPLATLFAVVFAIGPSLLRAADDAGGGKKAAGAEKTLHAAIKALVANDYPSFLALGTRDLSSRISKDRFEQMRQDTVAPLKNGYTAALDVEVPEADGSVSSHWKITPRKGDELHAILTLKKGKVHDLSLQ